MRGYFFMSAEVGKMMRETGGGAIVRTFFCSCAPRFIREYVKVRSIV